jgi:hypothetical protein
MSLCRTINRAAAVGAMSVSLAWADNSVFSPSHSPPSVQTAIQADRYCRSVDIRKGPDRERVLLFAQTISQGDLWTNLIDAGFFRPELQPAGYCAHQPRTFFGQSLTNYGTSSFVWGNLGLHCDGISNYFVYLSPPLTNFTLLICLKQDPTFTNTHKGPFCLTTASGMAGEDGGIALWNGAGHSPACLIFKNGPGPEHYLNHDLFYDSITNQGFWSDDYRIRTLGISVNTANSNIVCTTDGIAGPSYVTPILPRVPLDHLQLGLWFGTEFWRGDIISFALFNAPLTVEQQAVAQRALRYLEPSRENVVIYGDSLSSFWPGNYPFWSYGYQAFELSGLSNAVTFYNTAFTGQTTASLRWWFANDVHPFRPYGGVRSAMLYYWAGINDCWRGGVDASGAYANLRYIWATARQWGYDVTAFTLHRPDPASLVSAGYVSPPWTPAAEAMRVELNSLILSDPSLYDDLIRVDVLIPSAATNAEPLLSLDGIHLNAAGNAIIAREILRHRAFPRRHRLPRGWPDLRGEALSTAGD